MVIRNTLTFEVIFPVGRSSIRFTFGNRDNLDYIASLVRAKGLAKYEEPTPAVLVTLVQEANGLVLDVGANTGLYSLLAAASNPASHVYAFEPLETVRELLCANIAFNPELATRITVIPIGLSRAAGNFPFFETINDQGLITTSSSMEVEHARRTGQYREHTIATDTLDSWCEKLGDGPIQLIKIDVEGHEHAVIEAGHKTIDRHRPFIILEVLGPADMRALDCILTKADYIDIALAPEGLRRCSNLQFHADAWNHLLCPFEKANHIRSLGRHLGLCIKYR